MPTMQIGALLEPGLRSEAAQVYNPIYGETTATIGDVVWLEGTSDKFQEVFGFLESPLYFGWWPAETPPPSGSIKSQRFVIKNVDFGVRNYLPRNVEDDQTGTAMQFARAIAQNYAVLPVEIFYQHLQATSYNGSTAPYPYAVTAADGTALYSASTRYGSSSGNTVSTTGTSTVQTVVTDISSVKRRFAEFQNTQGRPFFDPSQTDKLKIFYGTAITQVMDAARAQTLQHSVVSTTGAAVTNLLKDAGFEIEYVRSQRITDSKYYCFLRGLPNHLRPMWRQVRKGYTEWQGNFVTSDHSRDTGQVYVQGECREGWGMVLAIGTIKVA